MWGGWTLREVSSIPARMVEIGAATTDDDESFRAARLRRFHAYLALLFCGVVPLVCHLSSALIFDPFRVVHLWVSRLVLVGLAVVLSLVLHGWFKQLWPRPRLLAAIYGFVVATAAL